MTNVLVCIKRVPDTGGEVELTADQQGVDGHRVLAERHRSPDLRNPLDADQDVHGSSLTQPLSRSLAGSNSDVASADPTVTGYSSSM